MTAMQRLSEAIYVGLCHKIGTHEEVSMRRDIADIENVIEEKSNWEFCYRRMLSGSYREGFRLSGSDQDYMFWPPDHKVICDLSQVHHYLRTRTTLFLMECVESRPGYVSLQLLIPSNDSYVSWSCVRINDLYYISSSLYRKHSLFSKEFTEHGPCSNIIMSRCEFDCAFCLSCDFWPPQADSWIRRCRSWPPPPVCYEIIVSGCHFMSIGSKGSPNEDNEWRLSFSLAEQKLVYAMNHCQFLVYGLLKLFLKEVINEIDQTKSLCSYFMKTAVFWEIQESNISSWCPQNILICFWACYKRIIKWVYNGYCPNFFVTENNMFLGKFLGCSQITLYIKLHKLYEKGMSCLLYCKSIRSYLYNTICHPTNIPNLQERRSSEKEFMYAFRIFYDLITLINTSNLFPPSLLGNFPRCLQSIEYLFKTKLTKIQVLSLNISAILCLNLNAFCIQQMHMIGNRTLRRVDISSYKMLKSLAKSGFVSDMLFLVIYYYNKSRYTEALSFLHNTEVKLMQHKLTYQGNLEKIIVEIGGQNFLDIWKRYMLVNINLRNDIIYVNLLTLEQRISSGNNMPVLYIPTLVLLRMLYVLCYNHVSTDRRREALNDLYTLVHHDTGRYIVDSNRDISFQILGICQEMCGDFYAAIDSYNLSLECEPFNKISEASLIRIQHAFSKLGNMS